MNTKQIQYALALAETLNFSRAAEQLGIFQPALSKQILNLENELGVKLFDRTTNPLALTSAGEYFLREAQSLLYQEDQLRRSLEEFKSGERGRLVIGLPPLRALYLIPTITAKLRERFPGVQVVLHESSTDTLRKEAAEGKYDLAIVTLPVDESVLDVTPIEPDTMVLAVPKAMAAALPFEEGEPFPIIGLENCRDLPFISVGQTQVMRQLFEKTCAAANFRPYIAAECVGVTTAWALCRAGVGATLLPLQLIRHIGGADELALFTLKHSVRSRELAIITRRGQYLSPYAAYAIQLLTEQADSAKD